MSHVVPASEPSLTDISTPRLPSGISPGIRRADRNYRPLLEQASRHAGDCLALSYPRDRWYVRLGNGIKNAKRRIKGNQFRTFIHPVRALEKVIGGERIRACCPAADLDMVRRCLCS
jgi:hypothetical protein